MCLRHLEWLIGESVQDANAIFYEMLPYAPAQAERIIEQLCGLTGLEVAHASDDPVCAERVRQAFGFIGGAAGARQALLDLQEIEREIGRSPWRDLLKGVASRPPPVCRHDPRQERSHRVALGDRRSRAGRSRWPPLAASSA
jgi:hypothetical protein